MNTPDPRDYDLRRLRMEAAGLDSGSNCPNGPDPETGEWPCDPKGYFGVAECQTCGWVGTFATRPPAGVPAKETKP